MFVLWSVLSACSWFSPPAPSAAPEVPAAVADVPAAPDFGVYVLALTWEPAFCCEHPSKGQCEGLTTTPTPFGANHLTIHGLWPNYTDAEVPAHGGAKWPEFCGKYAACDVPKGQKPPAWCAPDLSAVPPDMATYGPGYVTDDAFLARHEWAKHGSCSGLDPARFFAESIRLLTSLPGDRGTPAVVSQHVGQRVSRAALAASFGDPDAVMLACDATCALEQVEVCFAHDGAGRPTTPTACPEGARKTAYNNSCALQRCEQVTLPAAGQCALPAKAAGGAPDPASHCRADRGQGPACADDEACAAAGFLRCARSGCCTNQRP